MTMKMNKLVVKDRKNASPLTAIRLFCTSCMGGEELYVSKCEVKTCGLWKFRNKAIGKK
jgi:hypothetical protein